MTKPLRFRLADSEWFCCLANCAFIYVLGLADLIHSSNLARTSVRASSTSTPRHSCPVWPSNHNSFCEKVPVGYSFSLAASRIPSNMLCLILFLTIRQPAFSVLSTSMPSGPALRATWESSLPCWPAAEIACLAYAAACSRLILSSFTVTLTLPIIIHDAPPYELLYDCLPDIELFLSIRHKLTFQIYCYIMEHTNL